MTYLVYLDLETASKLFEVKGEFFNRVEGCTISNGLIHKGKYSIPVSSALLIEEEV